MTATTAQLQRPQEQTGNWSAIFPNEQVTETQSALFVKKLLAVSVSNIAYLRAIFPEHAFGDRCLEDLGLKILRDDSSCPGACQVIKWVKGCFDALDKKYLRMLVIGIYVDPDDPDTVIESYTFKFSYNNQGGVDTSIYRNDKKISSAYSEVETKKATIRLLRTIVVLTQNLDSLPDDVMMTMKLLYYDDVTPADYEPPGFKSAESDSFRFDEEPMNIKIGDVSTVKEDPVEEEVTEKTGGTIDVVQQVHEDKMDTEQDELNTDKMQTEIYDFNEEEATEVKLSSKGKTKRKFKSPDAVVPTESPAKPGFNDNAVDTTGSQTSQVLATEEEEFGVRCPCGCNEDDGLMVLCAVCKFWQHGVCFLILNEDQAPDHHVCDVCAVPGESEKDPTDAHLCGLSSIAVQATCLWRRALWAVSDMSRVLAPNLAKRLGIEMTVAQGVMNRLEKEGFIRNPGKGKRLGKIVEKSKIQKDGFAKYLQKTDPSDSNEKKMETKKNDINMEEDIEKKQILQPEVISNKISEITAMTSDMKLSKDKKKKKKLNIEKLKQENEVRHSPRINASEKAKFEEDRRRGKKRAFSKVDQIRYKSVVIMPWNIIGG